jgi:coenzyme F420 hydrogenase subunit delta
MNDLSYVPSWYKKSTLVLGCGNVLFGDDGFGPAVAEQLIKNYALPDDVYVMNVGTSARDILFTLTLAETKVKRLIIIDAVDHRKYGRKPGEIFELSPDELPPTKISDFSVHQVPSTNLLRELQDYRKIEIIILVCQIEHIPREVAPGLSEPVKTAIRDMCDRIYSLIY